MSSFIIQIGSTISNLVPDIGFAYTDRLNDVNEANFRVSGQSSAKSVLIVNGAPVEILRNGVREFYGFIDKRTPLEGGGTNFHASGYEIWLAKEPGTYSNSPYQATASATIFGDVIGDSTHWNLGGASAGLNIDARFSITSSLFSAVKNLLRKTAQDLSYDYSNLPGGTPDINIVDVKGSATSIAVLNDKIQIRNLKYTTSLPLGNDVRVYGKGDGSDQIVSDAANGQDASSKSTYGTIRRIVIDRSLVSVSEANTLADAEVAVSKDETELYDFEVVNPALAVVSGDVVDLTSPAKFTGTKTVRTVEVMRGMRKGAEFLDLKVANSGFSRRLKTLNRTLATIKARNKENETYMQGTANTLTFSGQINANNGTFLAVDFMIPNSWVEDEAGNLRISSLTVDYDVDKYRKSVGSVAETNKDPDIDDSTVSSADNVSTQPANADTFDNTINLLNTWTGYQTWNNIGVHGEAIIFHVHVVVYQWDSPTDAQSLYARILHVDNTDYFPSTTGVRLLRGVTEDDTDSDTHSHGPGNGTRFLTLEDNSTAFIDTDTSSALAHTHEIGSTDNFLYIDAAKTAFASLATDNDLHDHAAFIQLNGTAQIYIPIDPFGQDFTVQFDTTDTGTALAGFFAAYYVVSRHSHGDGSYKTDLHKHDVSVGDSASDAGSVNASEVDIYLDEWVGGSAWVERHSVLNTGKTLDTNVDLSNGGVYPNVAGLWRVRVGPDNASPDLVIGIVRLKHQLDS